MFRVQAGSPAKAQRKPLETRQGFAPLRLCGRPRLNSKPKLARGILRIYFGFVTCVLFCGNI